MYCLYHGNIFYEHRPWFPHPETPERLKRLVKGLRENGLLEKFRVIEPPLGRARRELALEIHTSSYVELIETASLNGRALIDPDTYVNEKTFQAALAVLASVEDAVDRIESGECSLALVAGRPPGHHAGINGAAMGAPTLGFCIFNASALASRLLAEKGHRVLHIDFDLHHGNGTQEILYEDPRVLHIDFHQDPDTVYPGTGYPEQIGSGAARGTKINIVLPYGAGDDIFVKAVDDAIEIVERKDFNPTVLVFSAGFDGYIGDGLGGLRLTGKSYAYLAERMREVYRVPVLVVWEGGYTVGLEKGAPAFISALMGEKWVESGETKSAPKTWEMYYESVNKLWSLL